MRYWVHLDAQAVVNGLEVLGGIALHDALPRLTGTLCRPPCINLPTAALARSCELRIIIKLLLGFLQRR